MLRSFIGLATILIVAITQLTLAFGQEPKSHLVIFSPTIFQKTTSVVVASSDKIVNTSKWIPGIPFYRDFIIAPGEYRINLKSIAASFSFKTSGKTGTFFQIDKYTGDKDQHGLQFTVWRGQPNSATEMTINQLIKAGFKEAVQPIPLENVGNIITFDTEPPWPGPFGPPPNPSPKPPQPK